MQRHTVLTFEILCPAVPLEITGTIDGYTFYYRGRHDRWAVYRDIYDFGISRRPDPIAHGNSNNGDEHDLVFAIKQICDAFQEQLNNSFYPSET